MDLVAMVQQGTCINLWSINTHCDHRVSHRIDTRGIAPQNRMPGPDERICEEHNYCFTSTPFGNTL